MQSKGQGRISAQTNVSASPNNSIKKSLRNIREKSHQEFYTNRAAKLGNIFTQNGFDLDSLVTEDEVLTFLDTLGKEPFNREIATQLFEKLPFQESGNSGDFRRFILRDFIDMHIKAEYLLLIRAEEIEGELDTVYNQIEGLRDQFVEVAKKTEARIENNTLQVDIVEVVCDDEDYQAEIGSVFSVIVVVGNYKYETDEIVIDQPKFNPKFNWTFHFKFDTPDEKMQILLRDQKRFGTDDDYTDLKCTINLKNYRDQIKHVTWLTLYNAYQQPTKFKVHLDIQWQFSKLAFHEEKFGELQVLEEKLNEEKEYIETSIKLLVHPFAFASSSKTRGVSQGFKSDPNVRMTQSIPGDMIGTRQTVHESYSQSKDQPQPRLAQSYYSEQNAPYNKQPSIESNKSSAMLPEGNSRVAESLQSSKNPSELAMSDKKARVTQSYQSSTQPFQLGQNANVGGDFRKMSQGNTPVMPVLGGGNMGSTNQSRHCVQSYPPEQNSASGSEGFRKLETFSAQGNTPVMPVLGGGNMGSTNQSRHYVQSFQAEQNVVNVEGGGFRKLETFSSQGNTPVMPVLGGGNMGSTNQSKHYVQSYPPEQNSASGEGGLRKMETFSAQGNSPVIPVLGGGSVNQSRNYSQNYQPTQPTQPYQPFQQEQGGLQKLGTFSAQGNTPVMPVLGGGNMGSANQSRYYGGIGGGFSPQVNSPYRQPSDASETSIKRIAAKNPFENPALDYKGTKLVPQTTGNFGAFGGDRPVVGADPLRRMPSNQSEKSMRSAEAAVGIQPKRFENVKSGNQSRDQAELRGDMQAGQSYMSNQSGKAGRVGSDPLRPEAMGYDQRGYRKNPSNFA